MSLSISEMSKKKDIKKVVNQKIVPLLARQKVAFWGAGDILDMIVNDGGLNTKDIDLLVDSSLGDSKHKKYNIHIQKPEVLCIYEPNIVIVLASSSEEEIAKRANKFGVRHVLRFSELLEQVRI